jgi:hypothetical protein
MGAMGAAEPLRSVLWVKQQRCAVSLEPARALLRWWRSPGPGPGAPGAGECRRPGLAGSGAASARGLRRPDAPGRPGRPRWEEGGRGGGLEWGDPRGRGPESPGPGRRGGGEARAVARSQLDGKGPGAESIGTPGTGMTKSLEEVLEGEGKGRRPQPSVGGLDPERR